ncbi:MAG TPA: hypothetical protein PLH57_10200, partial [Oligoflexia bacterium]|nr:hypothetical protein [Oligoflexia bacterium]
GTAENRSMTICLSASGHKAEQARGNDIINAFDPVIEIESELDSVYSKIKANLTKAYENIPSIAFDPVVSHCDVIDGMSNYTNSHITLCTWKYLVDLNAEMKGALKNIKNGAQPLVELSTRLMIKYPEIYEKMIKSCVQKNVDEKCLKNFAGRLGRDKMIESIDGFRRTLVLDTWLKTLQNDISRRSAHGKKFRDLNRSYASHYIGDFDGEAVALEDKMPKKSNKKKGPKKKIATAATSSSKNEPSTRSVNPPAAAVD